MLIGPKDSFEPSNRLCFFHPWTIMDPFNPLVSRWCHVSVPNLIFDSDMMCWNIDDQSQFVCEVIDPIRPAAAYGHPQPMGIQQYLLFME